MDFGDGGFLAGWVLKYNGEAVTYALNPDSGVGQKMATVLKDPVRLPWAGTLLNQRLSGR